MVLLSWGLMLNTIFGNKLMSVYNKKVFLVTILTRQMLLEKVLSCFYDVSIHIQGVVALFTARNKNYKK